MRLLRSRPKSIEDPSYRAFAQCAKVVFGQIDAATVVQLDQAHGRHGDGKRDLKRIVGPQRAFPDALLDGLEHRTEGGRSAGAKVVWELPRLLASLGDHKGVQMRLSQREV